MWYVSDSFYLVLDRIDRLDHKLGYSIQYKTKCGMWFVRDLVSRKEDLNFILEQIRLKTELTEILYGHS